MKYRNMITGFVFETSAECAGEAWEEIPASSAPVKAEKAEAVKAEAEPAKPKRTSRKGTAK